MLKTLQMNPELSIVIPVRNEAPCLAELHRELTETLGSWGRSYEIIIVDDGSTDDSFKILAALQVTDPRLHRLFDDLEAFRFLIALKLFAKPCRVELLICLLQIFLGN